MIQSAYDADKSMIDILINIWNYLSPYFDNLLTWQNQKDSAEVTAKYSYEYAKKMIFPYIESLNKMSPLSQEEKLAIEENVCNRKNVLLYNDYVKECFVAHDTAIIYIKKLYENRAVMGFVAYEAAADKNWINRPSTVLTPGWDW